MKRKQLYIATSIVAIFIYGCADGGRTSDMPVVSVQEITLSNDISDVVRIDGLTLLEESDGSFLIHPDKAFVLPDGSVIFKDKGHRILKFSAGGEFLGTIGKRGRGPQEYNLCRDISLSPDGKELSVMDLGGIVTYDASDGSFLRKISIPQHNYDEFCYAEDGGYFLFSASPDMEDYSDATGHDVLTRISPEGEAICSCLPRKDFILNTELFTRSCKGSIFLRTLEGENILYEINGNDIRPVLQIDFGSLQSPEGYLSDNGVMNMQRYIESRYYKMAMSFHDTENSIYFECMGPRGSDIHYVIRPDGKAVCSWKSPDNDPSPSLVLASDTKSFYVLVFDPEGKAATASSGDKTLEDMNPVDRAVIMEMKSKGKAPNGNPLLARISFPVQ